MPIYARPTLCQHDQEDFLLAGFLHGRIYGRIALRGSRDWSFLTEGVDNF